MTTYAVLDLETTGLSPREGDRIIEIAAIGLDTRLEETWRFETLVSIDRPVSATEVHGLTRADLVGAPTFAKVAPRLGELLGSSVLVAHYPRFDLGFLDAELERLDGGLPACGVIDTRDLGRAAGVRGSLRLGDCCAHLGVSNHRAHAAMGDVETTVELMRACVDRGVEVGRFVRVRAGRTHAAAWPAPVVEAAVRRRAAA